VPLGRLSLRDLEYLVAVAELGHFGRAADRCAVSQPALSAQIRKLEETLGVLLFERAPRRVLVTPAAKPIIEQARRTIAEAQRLLEVAASATGHLCGELNLWSIATLGPYLIPHILCAVRDRFAQIKLYLGEGLTEYILAGLRIGEIDAAFLSLPINEEGLCTHPLFFEPFVVIYPRGHPLERLKPLCVSQLAGDGLLLLDEGHCLRDQALDLCGSASRVVRHVGSLETVRHLVAAGVGYSILPALAVRDDASFRDLLRFTPLADPGAGRRVALVWRKSDPRAPFFHALAELVQANPAIRALTAGPQAGNPEQGTRGAAA
jgi:LysR family hydrogen peroxide-inducible transcriptional activator